MPLHIPESDITNGVIEPGDKRQITIAGMTICISNSKRVYWSLIEGRLHFASIEGFITFHDWEPADALTKIWTDGSVSIMEK